MTEAGNEKEAKDCQIKIEEGNVKPAWGIYAGEDREGWDIRRN